jgi:hypothetical protein
LPSAKKLSPNADKCALGLDSVSGKLARRRPFPRAPRLLPSRPSSSRASSSPRDVEISILYTKASRDHHQGGKVGGDHHQGRWLLGFHQVCALFFLDSARVWPTQGLGSV